jgi:hypothetical protein
MRPTTQLSRRALFVYPLKGVPMSPDQIILIGLIASAITFGLRIAATYANYHPGRVAVNIGLYVVSAGLALAWTAATVPAWPPFDGNIAVFFGALWQWLNDLVALGAPIMGTASLIYNLLYDKVIVLVWARLAK